MSPNTGNEAYRTALEVTEEDREIAEICKALAHPARVLILRNLLAEGTCIFGSLADKIPLAPSTVAQHLKLLSTAGLIRQWTDGHNSCYCINRSRIDTLSKLLNTL